MRPTLFTIGALEFPSYTFLIMLGVLVAVYVGYRLCKAYNLPVIYALDMGIIGILFGFLGARIAHVLVEKPDLYWNDPIQFFYFWQGGFVSWGAHIAVLLGWYFYLRWRKQPVWAYFDVAAVAVPLAIFFGRIGCLLNGCCFGKPTDFFLSLTFSDPSATAYYFYPNEPLHATQIYLMLNVFIIFCTLVYISFRKWRFQGRLISLAVIFYSVGRGLIEFLRGDIDRGVYFGGWVSSGQWAMLAYLGVGILAYQYFKRKGLTPPNKTY